MLYNVICRILLFLLYRKFYVVKTYPIQQKYGKNTIARSIIRSNSIRAYRSIFSIIIQKLRVHLVLEVHSFFIRTIL